MREDSEDVEGPPPSRRDRLPAVSALGSLQLLGLLALLPACAPPADPVPRNLVVIVVGG